MFESITQFFKKFRKSEKEESKSTAKERLHLVLAQDRANISADFLEMMKQEILEVIKKYIDIDEKAHCRSIWPERLRDVRRKDRRCKNALFKPPGRRGARPLRRRHHAHSRW